MSAHPVSPNTQSYHPSPSHGHPSNTSDHTQPSDKPSTASHPPHPKPDPTTSSTRPSHQQEPASTAQNDGTTGGLARTTASSTQLTGLKVKLRSALRQFPDFPSTGILFEDIMPIFASYDLHNTLIRALELQVAEAFHTQPGEQSNVDVVVGLESRGFLFGPTLALRLGAGFVPIRKKGKLPGSCETATFTKEYGEDVFQMQSDAITKGQKVIVVDDIIATGGSASAAGTLVRKLGGDLLGYLFMMELDFLKGRARLDAPVHTLLSGQEEASKEKVEFPLGQTKESADEPAKPIKDAGGAAAEVRP